MHDIRDLFFAEANMRFYWGKIEHTAEWHEERKERTIYFNLSITSCAVISLSKVTCLWVGNLNKEDTNYPTILRWHDFDHVLLPKDKNSQSKKKIDLCNQSMYNIV